MEIASETVGLVLEIIGVLVVLLSQIQFGYRSRKKGLRRTFLALISVARVGYDPNMPDEKLKELFPEWWEYASYLREDIWITGIGLVVTLTGLLFELLPV